MLTPNPRTTLPTTEAVLKVPPTLLSMLTELDSSHNLLFFSIIKRFIFWHFEKMFQLQSASVSSDDF